MHRKTPGLNLFRLVAILLSLFLSACEQPNDSASKQYDYSIFAFGTLIDVTLYSTDKNLADEAFALLQKDFDRFHQQWSPWTDGDLAQLNTQLSQKLPGKSRTITIPSHLVPIIKKSMELSNHSNNFYNPSIGKLINLWQFHRSQEEGIQPPTTGQPYPEFGQAKPSNERSFI